MIEAVIFKVTDKGTIQLYDIEGNKVDGHKARWKFSFHCCGENLTSLEGAPKEVGGDFYCTGNQLVSLKGAPKEVGNCFYCDNNELISPERAPKENCNKVLNRIYIAKKERGYLYADGILQKIISVRQKDDLEIFKVRGIGCEKESFCVKRENTFSHGETLKEAMESLTYKISDRDTTEFKSWTLETVATKEKFIEAYRKITGACGFGVKEFVEKNNPKEKLSVKEVIDLTNGYYGSEKFASFFKNKILN